MIRRNFIKIAGAASAAALLGVPARADEVLLTITGNVTDGARAFTDADLLALPQISFETSTIWTDGVLRFSGPSVASVLEAAGAGPGDITFAAVNDYVVSMPRNVVEAGAPIIANRIGGEPFSRRDKGPLWIVFPYDSDARFRAESLYAYSVWQLVGLTVG
ncbi:twin-arginine translocation signal domain-containing protein [Roseicyclus mahoneyensis]|uniref:Oxidoreductase molybdopterin-binding domain-containing protein n=1 Tax=Roseicyclus mahoneyensis TaxID=164332 RepID=A0A316GPY0_9RHOB|nr:oxidoreductase [Roseicyclus mahoneyensis]PWK62954.1 hypothetical protein C7455_101995 [Roseicyclus mahoneyensis]